MGKRGKRFVSLNNQKAESKAPLPFARLMMPTGCLLSVGYGDITTAKGTDAAIVNAASVECLGGGGVDGAIHRAAGPELLAACKRLPVIEREKRCDVRCPTGEARSTIAARLDVKAVIHAVGPVYRNAAESAPVLASTLAYSLVLARMKRIAHVAVPAISCGVYGYPHEEAAEVAMRVLGVHSVGLREVSVYIGERAKVGLWVDAAVNAFSPPQAGLAHE